MKFAWPGWGSAHSCVTMYSVGPEHEAHYTVPNSHYLPHHTQASPSLTSSTNILNYDATSPLAPSEQQIHTTGGPGEFPEYKREPSTPTQLANMPEYPAYPSAFTPSPSLSGSESPRTPNSYYQPSSSSVYPPTSLEGGERLAVPFPAPTPPLSATHLAKEVQHSLPDTESVKFSNEQIDCICDTLQQRKDMNTLGECNTYPVRRFSIIEVHYISKHSH